MLSDSLPDEGVQDVGQSAGRVGTFHHVILQSKHQLTTASIYHVTNLTPGSDNPTGAARPGPC
jgi:hypothetical protein